MKVIAVCVLLVGLSVAIDVPYTTPVYSKPNYDYGPPMPFAFGYAVKDGYYNDHAHETQSDGKVRTGSYRTLLPDGRIQIVKYRADDYGYVADVQYQGEAKYDSKTDAYKPAAYVAPAVYPVPAAYPIPIGYPPKSVYP